MKQYFELCINGKMLQGCEMIASVVANFAVISILRNQKEMQKLIFHFIR